MTIESTPTIASIDLTNVRPCLLMYDIPDKVPEGKKFIQNPSPKLRKYAVRLQYSCWVIPEAKIPYNLLGDMQENGAEWDAAPFDAQNAESLLNMARVSLLKELQKGINSQRKAMENTARLLAEGELSAQEAEDRTTKAEKRCKQLIHDLQHASAFFGLQDVVDVEASIAAALAIRQNMHARAKAYRDAAETLRVQANVSGSSATEAIANGAFSDDLPANVLGDYLIETTGDMSAADTLIAAFADPINERELSGDDEADTVIDDDGEIPSADEDPPAELVEMSTQDWYARMSEGG